MIKIHVTWGSNKVYRDRESPVLAIQKNCLTCFLQILAFCLSEPGIPSLPSLKSFTKYLLCFLLSCSWFREINGHLQSVRSSARYDLSQDILHIKRLKPEDSGRWTCKVSNNFGEQRLDIHLNVTAMMTVHILPQLQVKIVFIR